MGADYLAFRRCGVQQAYEPSEFLARVKGRAAASVVREVTGGGTHTSAVIGGMNNPARTVPIAEARHPQLVTDECAACPLARGADLGCWSFVTYPVDATFETTLHDYFCGAIDAPPEAWLDWKQRDGTATTSAALLHGLFLAEGTPSESVWHARRPSPFATLLEPLIRRTRLGSISSADVLHCTFQAIDGDLALRLYASLFTHYVESVGDVVRRRSRTVDELWSVSELLEASVALDQRGSPVEVLVVA